MEPTSAFSTEAIESIARRYRRFALVEAEGISPTYFSWAHAVAADEAALHFVAALPPAKQQPNLLFAAVRAVRGDVGPDAAAFLTALQDRSVEVAAVMQRRSNQTNEAARCGVLLPALNLIAQQTGQPLSLIEIGASAGLCLIPDRYRYRWHGDGTDHCLGDGGLEIDVPTSGPVPLPHAMPEIVWRAGLDLNPLDLTDDDDRTWLETLIWPEHDHRLTRLRAAISAFLTDPVPITRGDLRSDLGALIEQAPSDTTVIVFHSAVLPYLGSRADIDAAAAFLVESDAHWVSNEACSVLPDDCADIADDVGRDFCIMIDRQPVAAAGPHGQSLRWF